MPHLRQAFFFLAFALWWTWMHGKQLQVQYLAQEHFSMQTGAARDRPTNLPSSRTPAVPPELHPFTKMLNISHPLQVTGSLLLLFCFSNRPNWKLTVSLSQPCGSATFQFQVQFFLNERGAARISWKQYLWQHSCAPLTIDPQRFRKRGHLHFLCAAACLELSLFVSHGGEAVLVIKYRYRLCRNSKWLCRYGKT